MYSALHVLADVPTSKVNHVRTQIPEHAASLRPGFSRCRRFVARARAPKQDAMGVAH